MFKKKINKHETIGLDPSEMGLTLTLTLPFVLPGVEESHRTPDHQAPVQKKSCGLNCLNSGCSWNFAPKTASNTAHHQHRNSSGCDGRQVLKKEITTDCLLFQCGNDAFFTRYSRCCWPGQTVAYWDAILADRPCSSSEATRSNSSDMQIFV